MQETGLIKNEIAHVLEKEAELSRLKLLLDIPGNFDSELWQKAKDLGWPALAFDESVGGLGLGWAGLSELNEAMGAATAALPVSQTFLVGSLLLAANNANEFSSLLEQFCLGESSAAICLSEPGHNNIVTPSNLEWDGKLLTGQKSFAAFANTANVLLVSAQQHGETCLLLVEADSDGLSRGVSPTIDNARAYASLSFNGVKAMPIDVKGSAAAVLRALLNKAVVMTAYEQIGGASCCLNLSVAYAKERQAFGGPIGRYQAIKHKLADVYAAVEIARGCAIEAFLELEAGSLTTATACASRLAATHAYELAARDAIQVFGGIGVTWEAAPHHHYRRARCLAVEFGDSAYWQELLITDMRKQRKGKN